jgi:hypothetical protein
MFQPFVRALESAGLFGLAQVALGLAGVLVALVFAVSIARGRPGRPLLVTAPLALHALVVLAGTSSAWGPLKQPLGTDPDSALRGAMALARFLNNAAFAALAIPGLVLLVATAAAAGSRGPRTYGGAAAILVAGTAAAVCPVLDDISPVWTALRCGAYALGALALAAASTGTGPGARAGSVVAACAYFAGLAAFETFLRTIQWIESVSEASQLPFEQKAPFIAAAETAIDGGASTSWAILGFGAIAVVAAFARALPLAPAGEAPPGPRPSPWAAAGPILWLIVFLQCDPADLILAILRG